MHPLDLVEAAPWNRVVFTTYALSLSFVEAAILDRLVRGGGRGTMILADPEGVRAGLSEQGASRAGRDYELEPVVCSTGVFHPKLGLFFGDADAHMLIGSGNLTFGGWGMNLEAVEHIHPSFAAEAFDDAADFFDLMAIPGDAGLASSVLLAISTHTLGTAPETARRFLLRNDVDPQSFELDMDSIQPFIDVLSPGWIGDAFLDQVREARTAGEEVRAFLNAADKQGPRTGFERLQRSKYWSALSRVLDDPARRARLHIVDSAQEFCPKCRRIMPAAFQQDLRVLGVTDHCNLILCTAV